MSELPAPGDPRRIQRALDALTDDSAFDWDAAGAADPGEDQTLESLRLVARIASTYHDVGGPAIAAPILPAPFAWGPLQVLSFIGRGSYGDVYRARDPRLDRPVALKLLRHAGHDSDAVGSAAIEEGRLLARVRHPHVVTVYGAERIDRRVGIWMEFIDGPTVEEEVRQRGPLPAAVVARVGLDVSRAVRAVHDAGLVHRDLKAQNVMHSADGRYVLTDFGAADAGATRRDGHLTGTPIYMAPELLAGASPSRATDIYGFGVMLFHALTGGYPVAADSIPALRDAHQRSAAQSIRSACPAAPPPLAALIEQCLDPRAARRPTAQACEETLRKLAVPRAAWTARVKAAMPLIALAAVCAAFVVAARDARFRPPPASRGGHALVTAQLTSTNSSSAAISASAISPDGAQLLFADPSALYLEDLRSEGVSRISWSPPADVLDLSWIPGTRDFFVVAGTSLWRLSGGAGAPVRVRDDVLRASVSPDGRSVAFRGSDDGLWVAPVEGGRAIRLVEGAPHASVGKPAWSRDSQRIAFRLQNGGANGRRLAIESIAVDGSGRMPAYVAPAHGGIHQVLWAADGRLLFTTPLPLPRARYTNLWQMRVDPASGNPVSTPVQITDWPDFNFLSPSLTADGTRLVFTRMQFIGEVDEASLGDGSEQPLSALHKSVRVNEDISPLGWMPGGDVLFKSALHGDRLYRQGANGRSPQELWREPSGRELVDAAMTADGRWLLIAAAIDGRSAEIQRVPASGGAAVTLFTAPAYDSGIKCARARADVCVVYSVRDRQLLLWRLDPATGARTPLPTVQSIRSGETLDLSPDGTRLAMLPGDATPRILQVDVFTAALSEVSTGAIRAGALSWLGDNSGWILTVQHGEQGGQVLRFRSGAPPVVLWSSDWQRLVAPRVSPDGTRVAFCGRWIESSVWMLQGF